jgi:hypothetical protein
MQLIVFIKILRNFSSFLSLIQDEGKSNVSAIQPWAWSTSHRGTDTFRPYLRVRAFRQFSERDRIAS